MLGVLQLWAIGCMGAAWAQAPDPGNSTYVLHLTTFATNPSPKAIELTHAKDGSGRIFVSSNDGKIHAYSSTGAALGVFLDLSGPGVLPDFDSTQGFTTRGLSYMAFHPDYARAGAPGWGKLYTFYKSLEPGLRSPDYSGAALPMRPMSPGNVLSQYVVTEWTVQAGNPNQVDTATRREVIRIEYSGNGEDVHSVGRLSFNPFARTNHIDYGLLYIPLGDMNGGAEVANWQHVQDANNPFGKILRINPLASGANAYSVPASNPFYDGGSLLDNDGNTEEIAAWGFRNPQNTCFAKDTNDNARLVVFDIGAADFEEVNLVDIGDNHGWTRYDGPNDGNLATTLNLPAGSTLTFPATVYDHNIPNVPGAAPTAGGTGITGGFVVSDPGNLDFQDQLVFGDLPRGAFFHADWNALVAADAAGVQAAMYVMNVRIDGSAPGSFPALIGSGGRGDVRFGVDENGRMFVISKQTRTIFATDLIADQSPPLEDTTTTSSTTTSTSSSSTTTVTSSTSSTTTTTSTTSSTTTTASLFAGLYWAWECDTDPTTLDSNGDTIGDWVVRGASPPPFPTGSLTTDGGLTVYSGGGGLLDTRPMYDATNANLKLEVKWKTLNDATGNEWDSILWWNVDPDATTIGNPWCWVNRSGGNTVIHMQNVSGDVNGNDITVTGTGYFTMRWQFKTATDELKVYINGSDTPSRTYTYNRTGLNSDRFATVGLGEGKGYIDCVRIDAYDDASATPTIVTAGTPGAVNTTYGTASDNASFSVSGENMTEGILVTPPSAAFAVSTSAGGPFAETVTVGSAGTIASTPVYIRLKATADAGSYSGNIVCSSAGAESKNVVMASSTVSPKALTVTPHADQSKVYGAADPAYTYQSSGEVGAEGPGFTGALARDTGEDVGEYNITVGDLALADGTGGFLAANYTLSFTTGVKFEITPKALTVTATGPTKTHGTALTVGTSTENFTAGATSVGTETVTSVTLTPDAAGQSATTAVGQPYVVMPSAAMGAGGFQESNYDVTYNAYIGTVGMPMRLVAVAEVQVDTQGPIGTAQTTVGPVTYGVTAGYLDGALFTITETGVLTFSAVPNNDVGDVYYVEVTATDSATPPVTDKMLVKVTVIAQPRSSGMLIIFR